MTASTTNMLRIMKPNKDNGNTSDNSVETISGELGEKQHQFTPAPSMQDVLNLCLGPQSKQDNTPLK